MGIHKGPISWTRERREAMSPSRCAGFVAGLVAAAGLSVTFVALAGNARGDTASRAFKAMDSDGNGELSAAEHAAAANARFEALDPDRDGHVTEAELQAALYKMSERFHKAAGKEQRPVQMSAADRIAKVDTDGDGIMTAEEHAAGAKAMFEAMDADHNGSLTKAELKAGHNKLKQGRREPPAR